MVKGKEKGGGKGKSNDRQANGEGGRQRQVLDSQAQIGTRRWANRGSTAVQTPAVMNQCSRTDRQESRGRTQTALQGVKISQTAPSSRLEVKSGHCGVLPLYWHVVGASLLPVAQGLHPVAAGGRLEWVLRGTTARVSAFTAVIKTWPCVKDMLLEQMPFL